MTDLDLPLGHYRSGRARYAAAMALYNAGQLTPAAHEGYRICSLLDAQDPAALLEGPPKPAAVTAAVTATVAIRALVDAVDHYLATLPGPGVAEVRHGLNHWRASPVTAIPRRNPVLDKWLAPALTQTAKTHLARVIPAADWPALKAWHLS